MAASNIQYTANFLKQSDSRPVPIYPTLTGPQMLTRNIISLRERRNAIRNGDTFQRPMTKFETRMAEAGLETDEVHDAMVIDDRQSIMLGKCIAKDQEYNSLIPTPYSRHVRPLQEPVQPDYRPAYSYNTFMVEELKNKSRLGLTQAEVIAQQAQLAAMATDGTGEPIYNSTTGRGRYTNLRGQGATMEDAKGRPPGVTNRFDSEKIALVGLPKEEAAAEFMGARAMFRETDNKPGDDILHATGAPFTHNPSPRFVPGEFDNGAGTYDEKAFNFHTGRAAVAEADQADPMSTPAAFAGNSRAMLGGNSLITAGATQGYRPSSESLKEKGNPLTYFASRRR